MCESAGLTVVAMTQNVWGAAPFWPRRRRRLARLIDRSRPDVIGLQEVLSREGEGRTSQAHELADLVGGYHALFAPSSPSRAGGGEGVAILSRFPLRDHTVLVLSQNRADRLDRFGPRVVLRALADLPVGLVEIFVTHLSLSHQARARTVGEILEFADSTNQCAKSAGSLMLGDLNATPDDPALGMLTGPEGRWLDVWREANDSHRRGETWPAFAPVRRIDYVLAAPRDGWRIDWGQRTGLAGSDHRGVIGRLTRVPGAVNPS